MLFVSLYRKKVEVGKLEEERCVEKNGKECKFILS